jgi:hypothetical protein
MMQALDLLMKSGASKILAAPDLCQKDSLPEGVSPL